STARGLAAGMDESVDVLLDRVDGVTPEARYIPQRAALAKFPLAADHSAQAIELLCHPLVAIDDVIEYVGDAPQRTGPIQRQADRRVASLQGVQGAENHGRFVRGQYRALERV